MNLNKRKDFINKNSIKDLDIAKMYSGATKHSKIIYSKNDALSSQEPLKIEAEDGKKFIMLGENYFIALMDIVENAQNDLLEINLERDILQNMPVDFDDVWVVAKEELDKLKTKDTKDVDTKKIVTKIKDEYPNLFWHIDDILRNSMPHQ